MIYNLFAATIAVAAAQGYYEENGTYYEPTGYASYYEPSGYYAAYYNYGDYDDSSNYGYGDYAY